MPINNYYIEHSKNHANIYFKLHSDYNKYLETLKEEKKHEYHTYTTKNKKTRAFVLYTLYTDYTEEDIKEELISHQKINVSTVRLLKNTKSPLYFIVTDNRVTKRELNNKCNVVANTKVVRRVPQ